MRRYYRRFTKGFTLLELAVVSAVLIILLAIVAPTVSITQPNAIANQMWRFTEAACENYLTLTAAAQVDPIVPDKILAPGKYVIDIFISGESAIAPAYVPIYNAVGIKRLSHLVTLDAAGTSYVLTNSPGITVSFSYTTYLLYTTFFYVPFEVTQALADRAQPGIVLQTGTASYAAGNLMRYNCSNINYCTVDLLHWIPNY